MIRSKIVFNNWVLSVKMIGYTDSRTLFLALGPNDPILGAIKIPTELLGSVVSAPINWLTVEQSTNR